MIGELLPIWSRTWKEIWTPLSKSKSITGEFFVELVQGLVPPPRAPTPPRTPSRSQFDTEGNLIEESALRARGAYEEALAAFALLRGKYETAISNEASARRYFRKMHSDVKTESEAVSFLEAGSTALKAFENEGLVEKYRELTAIFLRNYSLRYEIRGEYSLHPTLTGLFAKMISEVKKISEADIHLTYTMLEFEEAFSDLKRDMTQARIKTCLQKQFNLLEALGKTYPGVTATTFGAICGQLSWPHITIKEIGSKLYGFRSDYPGLGHSGNPQAMLRSLESKDLIGLTVLLSSFIPFVCFELNHDTVYNG